MIKKIYLEVKWQIYRPIIWIQYGWGFLVVDLFLDMRDRKEEREQLQEGWKTVKSGVLGNDPFKTAEGQSTMKTVIYSIMTESMTE